MADLVEVLADSAGEYAEDFEDIGCVRISKEVQPCEGYSASSFFSSLFTFPGSRLSVGGASSDNCKIN